MGTTMLAFLLMWTDILLMGVFRESDEVGVYGICARLAAGILLVHQSLGPIFMARLSGLYLDRDWDAIRHLYRLTARWCMWGGLVLAWALAIWGRPILVIFGEEFAVGASVLAVLAAGKAVSVSSGLCGRVFGVTGKGRLNLINMSLMVGGNALLNLLWIPRYGALGAATATLVSLSGVKSLQVLEIWMMYRILPWNRKSLFPVLGIAALAAAAYPFRDGLAGPWGWLVPLALFGVACLVLFLRAGIGEEDREVWRAVRERFGNRRGACQ
jgi:O-antigen/teichoic acid export membrane protein